MKHTTTLAFMLVMLLVAGSAALAATVTVKNDLGIARPSETIEIKWSDVERAMPGAKALTVSDSSGKDVVVQMIDLDGDTKPDSIVFQSDFKPGESLTFTLKASDAWPTYPPGQSKVFGRFVPERYDDFAWESDKIAFRAYGPTLETVPRETGGSGVDVRVKRGGGLVLDEWYKRYKSGGAHKDTGDGADFYKVGLLRGCGGIAIWKNEKMYYAKGWRQQKVLANGPVRFVAELKYEPWDADGAKVSETKIISIDAGSNLTNYTSILASDQPELAVVIGLQKHQDPGQAAVHKDQGWMRYWDAADPGPNGNIGVGVVIDPAIVTDMKEIDDHVIAVTKVQPGRPLSYYAGAGWDRSGDFPDIVAWDAYLENSAKRVKSPLKVTIAP